MHGAKTPKFFVLIVSWLNYLREQYFGKAFLRASSFCQDSFERVWLNTATDHKGPQRTAKDRKGPQKTHKRPTKDRKEALHMTTEDRQSWENCQTCNNFVYFLQIILFIFCNFVFFCVFFVNFGVLVNYEVSWNDHFETPAQINQSFCFLFCAVGTWSTTTSQFLLSIWTLDGAGRSGRHQ